MRATAGVTLMAGLLAAAMTTIGACGGDDSTQTNCSGDTCTDARANDVANDVTTSPTDGGSDSSPSPCPGVPAGSLDTTFGSAGQVLASFSPITAEAAAIALQPDGKIVVAGYATAGGALAMGVARFDSSGNLDTTFGGLDGGAPGIVLVHFPGTSLGYAVAIQSDGKIVVAGKASNDPDVNIYDVAVVRLMSDGSFDNSFGTGGQKTIDLGSIGDEGLGVAVRSTGEIVIVGDPNGNAGAVVQLTSTGSPDPAFGGADGGANGVLLFPNVQDARAVLLDGDKIVFVGAAPVASDLQFYIARLDATGTADTTFALTGMSTADFGASLDTPYSVAKTSTGGYEVAGSLDLVSETNPEMWAYGLARFSSSGTPDSTFGTAGKVASTFGSNETERYGMALDPQDQATVVGDNRAKLDGGGVNETFILNRHASSGVVDSTFGGGEVLTAFGTLYSAGSAIVRQPDGKLVATGYAGVTTDAGTILGLALARYCP